MGQPWFEISRKPSLEAVVARSSNYEEYGAFSSRFHSTVASLAADVEVYSVDESFVKMPSRGEEPSAAADAIQARVLQWTGLPTAAGIGTTKTLAKVAQRHAKSQRQPLCDLTTWTASEVEQLLAATSVEDVWGIGSRLRSGLAGLGVHTALELAKADPGILRRRWSVALLPPMREGHPYNRAGILLTALSPAGAQRPLWSSEGPSRERLAAVVDEITDRHGRSVIGYGPAGLRGSRRWDMKRELLSPAGTTRWDQLLTAR